MESIQMSAEEKSLTVHVFEEKPVTMLSVEGVVNCAVC